MIECELSKKIYNTKHSKFQLLIDLSSSQIKPDEFIIQSI